MAAMVAALTEGGFMKPTTTIELESCTLVQMVTLLCVIEAERWVERIGHQERAAGFANQEKLRRAITARTRPIVHAQWR
jgi:hypothetical protein